jgi:hypothetical protein
MVVGSYWYTKVRAKIIKIWISTEKSKLKIVKWLPKKASDPNWVAQKFWGLVSQML